ncbi:baseplate tail fiber connector protein [Serratia phage Muldoon]|uniref:Baseplate tail fiber connector protein n=1 Tax=Serratia phage Muldoon TaxID=2601678 RepID=A0A5P8PHH1_9CAUD|nr:baseplate wedge subunit [Serratia phage Muldoon]QFR56114.1 baseplate tail fiber connector protein [Serratia phage Muldoon]WDS61704.1 hypothetical protein [Cronobacter phage vB_Cdu_VP8]
MSIYNSSTRSAARVTSRNATAIKYVPNGIPDIGGKRSVGQSNVRNTSEGVFYPNVQAAIDDLYGIATGSIGDGKITWQELPLAGNSQTQRLKFDGEARSDDGSDVLINVFGFPFVLKAGTKAVDIADIVSKEFTKYKNNSEYFNTVNVIGDGTTLEIQFTDNIQHEAFMFNQHGVTITGTITDNANPGYGDWELVGQEAKFGRTLYYYRRKA